MLNLVMAFVAVGLAFWAHHTYTSIDWEKKGAENVRSWRLILVTLIFFPAFLAVANFVAACITFANGEWV